MDRSTACVITILALLLGSVPVAASGDGTRDEVEDSTTDACSLGGGIANLTSGVSVTASLNSDYDGYCLFKFWPLDDTTHSRFDLVDIAANANFDLYVLPGNIPHDGNYLCRPQLYGTQPESCTLYDDKAQSAPPRMVYVKVRRAWGSGSFTLTASGVTLPPTCSEPPTKELVHEQWIYPMLTDNPGDICRFIFRPASDNDAVDVYFPGVSPTYGITLFVKVGSTAFNGNFDCAIGSPWGGNRCTVFTQGAPVHVTISRWGGGGSIYVMAKNFYSCSFGNAVMPLENATISRASFSRNFGKCIFSFDGDLAADITHFNTSSTDRLVFRSSVGTPPSGTTPLCSEQGSTTCNVAISGARTYLWVEPWGSNPPSFSVSATDMVLPDLANGVVLADRSQTPLGWGEKMYKVMLGENAAASEVALVRCDPAVLPLPCNTSHPLVMRVAAGRVPTPVDYDCVAQEVAGRKEVIGCTLFPTRPVAQKAFVMVRSEIQAHWLVTAATVEIDRGPLTAREEPHKDLRNDPAGDERLG